MRRLQGEDLEHGDARGCGQLPGTGRVLRGTNGRVQRRTERVGGLARRAEGQALGLEIGVLHRQRQDLVVQPAVFLEAAPERLQLAQILTVAQ